VQTYADATVLIDDPRVLACRIADIGEPLVDISTFPALAVDVIRAGVQQLSDNPFQVRSGVAGRLVQAQGYLPDGYRLQIKEGWRPVWVQGNGRVDGVDVPLGIFYRGRRSPC
jgi:hypothetical protein